MTPQLHRSVCGRGGGGGGRPGRGGRRSASKSKRQRSPPKKPLPLSLPPSVPGDRSPGLTPSPGSSAEGGGEGGSKEGKFNGWNCSRRGHTASPTGAKPNAGRGPAAPACNEGARAHLLEPRADRPNTRKKRATRMRAAARYGAGGGSRSWGCRRTRIAVRQSGRRWRGRSRRAKGAGWEGEGGERGKGR